MTGRWLVAAIMVVMVASAWFAPVDQLATERLDAGLTRALTSFAAARALNAAISVAQGTEVALEPGGVGVNLAPGQMLDPINDLVEQFSTLMLAASVAFGIEKMLVYLGAHWLLSLALTLAALAWIYPHLRHKLPPNWLSRALVLLLVLRFAIPAVTIGSDLLFRTFMADDFNISESAINSATSQVSEVNAPVHKPVEDQSILDKMKDRASELWTQTAASMDISKRFQDLKRTAEQWAEHIIKLIVIFLMQTLVIPLLLLWLLYVAARALIVRPD